MISYDFKANITTLLSTYLIPVLIGYGFSNETSNALIGVIVALIMIGCGMLNERYTSNHLTVEDDDVIDEIPDDDLDEEIS